MTETEQKPSLFPGGPLVIPIAYNSKRPAIKGWQDAARPRAAWDVKDWTRWPRWAILCGPANGIWVLDVDGVEGRENLRVLMELHRQGERYGNGPLALFTVHTPSGMHVYFKWGPGCDILTNTAGVIAPGLDVRTEGGYVLCPPTPGYLQ